VPSSQKHSQNTQNSELKQCHKYNICLCQLTDIYMKYTDHQPVNPSLMEHLLKCFGTEHLCLKSLPHKPQQNSLTFECFSDDVLIHLLCRNTLDIQGKHTASHRHDEINVP